MSNIVPGYTDIALLPDAVLPLSGSEFVPVVQGGVTKKATLNTLTVLASYVKTALPSPAQAGTLIYVTNEIGGAVPAFADGTNWRRVTDRAIVS